MDDGAVARAIAAVQVASILAWNAVPVAGVLLWDWPAVTVLLLYWVEAGLVVLTSGVRVATASGRSTPGSRVAADNLEEASSTLLGGSSFYFVFTLIMAATLSGPLVDLERAVSVSWFPLAVVGVFVGHAVSTWRYLRYGYADADPDSESSYGLVHYLIVFPVVVVLFLEGVDGGGWPLAGAVVLTAVLESVVELWGDVDWGGSDSPHATHTHVEEADLPEQDPTFVRRPDWRRLIARADARAFSAPFLHLLVFLGLMALLWAGSAGLIYPSEPMRGGYPHAVFVVAAFGHSLAASGVVVGLRYLAHRNVEYRFYDDRVVAVDRNYREVLWSFRYADLDGVRVAPEDVLRARTLEASGIRLIENWKGARSSTLPEFEDDPAGNLGTATPEMTELYGIADRELVGLLREAVHGDDRE